MKKLDCLLISPPHQRLHMTPYPYLGLCYLAGSLRERGIKVSILDCAALNLKMSDMLAYIRQAKPVIIGISAMSPTLRVCHEMARAIKADYPTGVIVLGGSHVNAEPQIISTLGLQYGLSGECEHSLADFCEAILGQGEALNIPGLARSINGKLSIQPPLPIDDLDQLPLPAYDLLPLEKYRGINTNKRTISMITSRGCPYNCIYCGGLRKSRYRRLSVDRAMAQIDLLVNKHNFQYIEFEDDIFTLDRQWVMRFCRELIGRGLKVSWGAMSRADTVDDELLAAMKEAGCGNLGFGVETGVERIRYLDHKKITNEKYHDAVNLCRRHGIRTMGFYIFGHPTETVEDIKETIRFSRRLGTDAIKISKMVPVPKSEIFEIALAAGQLPSDVWTRYLWGEVPYPIYYPEGVKPKTLDRLHSWMWFSSYFSLTRILPNIKMILRPHNLFEAIRVLFLFVSGKAYR